MALKKSPCCLRVEFVPQRGEAPVGQAIAQAIGRRIASVAGLSIDRGQIALTGRRNRGGEIFGVNVCRSRLNDPNVMFDDLPRTDPGRANLKGLERIIRRDFGVPLRVTFRCRC